MRLIVCLVCFDILLLFLVCKLSIQQNTEILCAEHIKNKVRIVVRQNIGYYYIIVNVVYLLYYLLFIVYFREQRKDQRESVCDCGDGGGGSGAQY